jgi:pentatricopeptide repeat protein
VKFILSCEVYFVMKWKFGIEPELDHCTCMVDLLGRHGKLKEALAIILKMVIFPDSRIWGALLAASKIHGDTKLGKYTAARLLDLEPNNVGYHTLLSNVQASVGQWDEVEEVRRVMNKADLKKKPGWSCIEAKGMIHAFVSADRSHHHVEEIYDVLQCLRRMIQEF